MIKLLLLDIDGVMTDGKVIVNSKGEENKTFCFKDFDAFAELRRREIVIGAITGEDTAIVAYIRNRVKWDYFYSGAKNKAVVVEEIRRKEGLSVEEICYVGDGKYDIVPLADVGLAVCPSDAIGEVKDVCDVILTRKGGDGCVWEVIGVIDQYNAADPTAEMRGCHD